MSASHIGIGATDATGGDSKWGKPQLFAEGRVKASTRSRGRPPKGEAAMSPAERQRAYRERQRAAVSEAASDLSTASRTTLVRLLASSLLRLDSLPSAQGRAGERITASRVLRELVARYRLKL